MISKSRTPNWKFFLGLSLASGFCISEVSAQTPAATYPTDPSAAAGMTSGMQNGLTAQQIEMMRVRTDAQSAQGTAVAASMARSVDQTLEAQNRDRTLQSAREIKAIKRSMQERLKWERANSNNTQVNKVSNADMSAWNTTNGNVRVERDVPDPFIASLIEEERRNMARGTSEKPKKGFNPLKSAGAALTSPFQRSPSSASQFVEAAPAASAPLPETSSGGGGFFSNLRVPKIGGRNSEEMIDASTAEPQFVATSNASAPPQPQPASAPAPGVVPRISGAELVGGSSPINETVDSPPTGSSSSATAPTFAPEPQRLPDESPDKPGLFSKLKSDNSTPSSSSGGGGFFSFGKKKEPSGPAIDASLFPAGSVTQAPTGGSLGGGYTAEDVVEESMAVPSSTGSIELPGETSEKKRGGFSIPKPNLSIPSIGSNSGSSGGSIPTLTTVNSSGNSFYVVTSTAQFMVYGDEQQSSEVRALPSGTVVRMTKPGEQWASIQLPNGSSGIVQNKFLRPASAGEAGGQFAASN